MTTPYTTEALAQVERIDITAAEIMPVLIGAYRVGPEFPDRAVARCEGIEVALLARDGAGDRTAVLAIACAHPRHGTHPRFAEAARRLQEILGARLQTGRACEVCGGAAWLGMPSAEANYQIMLAQCLGAWRGVALPPAKGAEGKTDAAHP